MYSSLFRLSVSSGQQFDYSPGSPTSSYNFEVQGLSEATGVPITAMLTPAGATQTAQASVNVNVGKPLQVWSVKDNAPGAALTADQQHAGVFLPISNITNKDKDPVAGIAYQLPIVIHALPGPATLSVPPHWIVVDANGKAEPAGKGLRLDPHADGSDIKLFVEATDSGGSKPSITLTRVGTPGHAPLWGNVAVTPFVLSYTKDKRLAAVGPVDVPQFGTYEYNILNGSPNAGIAAVKNGQWLTPTGSMGQPKGVNTNDLTVQWGAGPNIGKAIYQVDAQFIWDVPVSIFKIAVSTPTAPGHNAAAVGGTPKGDSAGTYASVTVSNLFMNAAFDITGPNGKQGLNHIGVGFVQNLTTRMTQAAYGRDPRNPNKSVTYSLASHNFGDQILDGHTFWDTQGYKPSNPLCNPEAGATAKGVASGLISTVDKPRVTFPTSGLNNGAIFNDTVVWNMTMYVVGATDEGPATPAPEAYLPWTFNGSSTFPNNTWQSNGGGVSYRTADGKPAWTAMDGTQPAGEKPFTIYPPQFNSLIQADDNLPLAQRIPPVFLK